MNLDLHQAFSFLRHFFLAKRKGHGVHSPLAYHLAEEVFYNPHPFRDHLTLSKLRTQLLKDETKLEILDLGAGSKTHLQKTRKVSAIVQKGNSTQKQSEMLYRLINLFGCRNILELGTSVGLNTLYLAMASRKGTVYTVEGCPQLSAFAEKLAAKAGVSNVRFLRENFDEALPRLLESWQPDFVYVDGNHTREATERYFELLQARSHPRTILVFDDINWSRGMQQAWNSIAGHRQVTLSIDLFYCGLVFFDPGLRAKTALRVWL